MTLSNEDLLAISQLLDVKLDARLKLIENRLKCIEIDLLENNFSISIFEGKGNGKNDEIFLICKFMQETSHLRLCDTTTKLPLS